MSLFEHVGAPLVRLLIKCGDALLSLVKYRRLCQEKSMVNLVDPAHPKEKRNYSCGNFTLRHVS